MQLDGETVLKAAGFLVGSGVLAGMIKLVYSCGKVIADINYLKTTTDKDVKADLRAIRKDLNETTPEIADIKSKVEILWRDRTSSGQSPRKLNRRGLSILHQTGIKDITEQEITVIAQLVRGQKPKNTYEAEQAVIYAVNELLADPKTKNQIEIAAFETSSTVDEISFVGAIHIRDKVLDALAAEIDAAKGAAPNAPISLMPGPTLARRA